MDKKRAVKYWLKSAAADWSVAGHLFEKKDYHYALFFGHLTIEKILKAIYVDRRGTVPPFIHSLALLAERIPIQLTDEQIKLFNIISRFSIEARYSDYKFKFWRRCTKGYTKNYLSKIGEIKEWLIKQIQS
ncbi:MAG: HEPN domain-containing protein [Planctomycetota bacterium]